MALFKIKYSILSDNLIKAGDLKGYIKDNFNLNEVQFNQIAKLKVDRFVRSHELKFKKECHFKHDLFVSKNRKWLERELIFDCGALNVDQNPATTVAYSAAANGTIIDDGIGDEEPDAETFNASNADENDNHHLAKKRRIVAAEYRSRKRRRLTRSSKKSTANKVLKPFDQCSKRTKRRRCVKMSTEMGENQLSFLYLNHLKSIGMRDEAKIVAKLRSSSPNRKAKILAILSDDPEIRPYTSDEALALMMDTDLSTYQYHIIQQQAKERNANIYPPYYKILESKKLCYPTSESISITDTGVNIKLQGLLDHTAAR